ncbi:MAG: hypothetical protein Q9159_007029 [Coniocarpon cinnabarinum]
MKARDTPHTLEAQLVEAFEDQCYAYNDDYDGVLRSLPRSKLWEQLSREQDWFDDQRFATVKFAREVRAGMARDAAHGALEEMVRELRRTCESSARAAWGFVDWMKDVSNRLNIAMRFHPARWTNPDGTKRLPSLRALLAPLRYFTRRKNYPPIFREVLEHLKIADRALNKDLLQEKHLLWRYESDCKDFTDDFLEMQAQSLELGQVRFAAAGQPGDSRAEFDQMAFVDLNRWYRGELQNVIGFLEEFEEGLRRMQQGATRVIDQIMGGLVWMYRSMFPRWHGDPVLVIEASAGMDLLPQEMVIETLERDMGL